MYKASKLDQYSIIDNLKKNRVHSQFSLWEIFFQKKKLRKEANSKQEFFMPNKQ